MKLTDKIQLGKRMTDGNGFVSVPAVITKVGIQRYHVDELMRDRNLAPSLKGKTGLINVFRSAETVNNPLTIDSFRNLPVTIQHPESLVDTTTAKFVTSGHVGSDVDMIDGERLGTTIYLHDADAIDISFGSETSAGYDCPIIAESGEYKGEKYDFRFDGAMIGNHLALVPAGRCGGDVGVLDNKMEIEEMDAKEVQKLIADELAKVDITKQVADAIAGIDIAKQVTDAIVASDKVKADAAAEKAKTDAESSQAKEDASAALAAKVALHTKLSTILDKDYDSTKTDKELMVLAVGETVEDAESKSDEYLVEKVTELADARKDAAPIADSQVDESTIKLTAF